MAIVSVAMTISRTPWLVSVVIGAGRPEMVGGMYEEEANKGNSLLQLLHKSIKKYPSRMVHV